MLVLSVIVCSLLLYSTSNGATIKQRSTKAPTMPNLQLTQAKHRYTGSGKGPEGSVSQIAECPPGDTGIILSKCQQCTKFEMNNQHSLACLTTGKKQRVKCKSTGLEIFVSCSVQHEEQKKFWIFEGVMFGVAVIFNIAVALRRRYLNAFLYQRLKRQFSDLGS